MRRAAARNEIRLGHGFAEARTPAQIGADLASLRIRKLLRSDRVRYNLDDLSGDLFDRMRGGASCQFVGERGRVADYLALAHVVPDWKENLGTGHGSRDQAIKLILRPSPSEERLRKDDNAEAAARETLVDLASQAVADPKLKLVIPNA